MKDFRLVNCEDINSKGDLDRVGNKLLVWKRNKSWTNKEKVKVNFEWARKNNEEPSGAMACELKAPDHEYTKDYFHASETNNDIDERGLMSTTAFDCENDSGIFVTKDRESAKGWAETLGAERERDRFDIFRVNVPNTMRVVEDRQPINKRAVPDSKIICTDNGISGDFVDRVETVDVEPGRYSWGGGGFR